jgi:hypothetical protein
LVKTAQVIPIASAAAIPKRARQLAASRMSKSTTASIANCTPRL